MTYRELYDWGHARLAEAKIREAALDARLLLEEVCGTDRGYLLVHGDEPVSDVQEQAYRDFVSSRGSRIPLQHILGYQEFMGLRFMINGDVLIPRQDTETLVEEVMRYLHDGMRILDMCTGSGCILLSLLQYSNDCVGVGSDISEAALAIARTNAEHLKKDAAFVQSDLFENIEGKYDVIVSNPPYIPTKVIETLEAEVRDYDPMNALDGKEDGLHFYRRIVDKAGEYLYPGGMLFFEIGHDEKDEVVTIMEEEGYREVTALKDLAGNDRVVFGTF